MEATIHKSPSYSSLAVDGLPLIMSTHGRAAVSIYYMTHYEQPGGTCSSMSSTCPCAPDQDLFLGVDGLSPVQWHPYSTVGGEAPATLVAHIKAYGRCARHAPPVLLRVAAPSGLFDGS